MDTSACNFVNVIGKLIPNRKISGKFVYYEEFSARPLINKSLTQTFKVLICIKWTQNE